MSWMCSSGLTRANVPQTSLAIAMCTTIHFFSNKDLLPLVKTTKVMKIHYGGTTFDQVMVGHICKELKHFSLARRKICIANDGIANLLSMGKPVEEEYQVTIDSDVKNAISFYNEDGSYIKFVCIQDGLYCINRKIVASILISLPQLLNRRFFCH